MPGVIDTHVHFNEPGLESWEGFQTGSAALAAGGGTCFLDMPLNAVPPTITVRALQQKETARQVKRMRTMDFGVDLCPVIFKSCRCWLTRESSVSKPSCLLRGQDKDGFRRSDDETLREGMRMIAETGKLLALHAEHEPTIARLTREARSLGRFDPASYTASRPIEAEVEAVEKALRYAAESGCRLHFVHISSESAAKRIREARLAGVDVTLETCPHYLCLTDNDFAVMGAVAKCAPHCVMRKNRGSYGTGYREAGSTFYLRIIHPAQPA